MPRGFGRLPFLNRRPGRAGGSDRLLPALPRRPLDAELAAVGPPALLPAMIYREILFDASEMTPVWARPRPSEPAIRTPIADAAAPGAAAPESAKPEARSPEATKPKRQRRPRTTPTTPPAAEAGPDKPKRTRKARPVSS